ncbi:MAG: exodeoxyribonuclease VII large subunit [Balneolales bacterium]|nr:exodeoxyribonuclease VII large subunit [Balneolales bacterium]
MQTGLFDAPPIVPGVTEFTQQIKDLLETSFNNAEVEGEISRPQLSSNGHLYFTLKDSGAQLPCVMWRTVFQRLSFKPEHGQQVRLSGDVQVYAPHGKYQFIVRSAEQAGLGALQLAFEKLKRKLEAEGLFRADIKKRLPFFPLKAGIVTSAKSAGLQDILATFEKRYPMIQLLVYHAAVQGVQAAGEIAKGIHYFSETHPEKVDVLIVTRGGGSLEDLWPFNEEVVARAIFKCPIPVISAVGHETDFTIADFVADVRAATPTQAVALMVPDINDLKYTVDELGKRLHFKMDNRLKTTKQRVDALAKTYALHAVVEKTRYFSSKVQSLKEKAGYLVDNRVSAHRRSLEQLTSRLEQLNPDTPLEQGYTRIWQNENWIKKATDLNPEESVEIQFKDRRISVSNK